MKIALIGNMNNNNFTIMRYFRDLGVDAHLLLNSNDGRGGLSHFSPEADTWNFEKWSSFIHQTDIPNAPVAAFDFPLSFALSTRSNLRYLLNLQKSALGAVTRNKLRRTYGKYDLLIGSGASPAILARIGKALDIFYPYAMGVEFLQSYEDTSRTRQSSFGRFFLDRLRKKQLEALRLSRKVFVSDREPTQRVLAEENVLASCVPIPMVYNRESVPLKPPNPALVAALAEIKKSGVSFLHHARLMWCFNFLT